MKTSAKISKKLRRNPVKLKVSRTHKPDDLFLEEWQRILRKQYGEQQKFRIKNTEIGNRGRTLTKDKVTRNNLSLINDYYGNSHI